MNRNELVSLLSCLRHPLAFWHSILDTRDEGPQPRERWVTRFLANFAVYYP